MLKEHRWYHHQHSHSENKKHIYHISKPIEHVPNDMYYNIYIYVYMYIYICMYIYMYIYVYISISVYQNTDVLLSIYVVCCMHT